MIAAFARLRRDARGVTAVEFAMVAPVLSLLLIGAMDVGHTLYMKAIVQGAVQKAGRDSGLESGTESANQDTIDTRVRTQILDIANNATININRQYFRSFTQAVDVREPFTDSNSNNTCDHNEPYVDENNNSHWDTTGNSGQGGAKDTVLYTVTVTYPRMFPLFRFIGVPNTVTVKGTTVLNNQPYGDQGSDGAPTVRNCT